MKTAVSIPDEVFRKADRLAKRMGVSRSELYAKALDSFVRTWDSRAIRDALNRLYASESSELDAGLQEMQARSLPPEKW